MHLLSFVHRGYLHESIHSVEHAYSFFDRSYSFLMEIKFVSQPDLLVASIRLNEKKQLLHLIIYYYVCLFVYYNRDVSVLFIRFCCKKGAAMVSSASSQEAIEESPS